MTKKHKQHSRIHSLANMLGIIVTLFFLLAGGTKAVAQLLHDSSKFFAELKQSFSDWSYSPLAFLIIYAMGYVTVWIKQLWGACIIITCSVFLCVDSRS